MDRPTLASYRFARRLVATLAAATLAACGGQRAAQTAAVPTVATVLASRGTIFPAETLAGIIAPFQNVAIQSSLAEPADEVDVQEGDHVSKGQLLARLDTADLEANLQADLATAQSDRAGVSHNVYQGSLSIAQGVDALRTAQSAVQQAQANLQRDSTDLSRYTQLYSQGYISQQQYQTQQTTVRNDQEALRSAQAQVASAQSNVQLNGSLNSGGLQSSSVQQAQATEQVALAQAQQVRVSIAKATIVSPIDGVVVNRNLNPGEYPGTRQIFTLQQIDPLYAVLHGSGSQVAHVAATAHATIMASDLGHNDKVSGRVIGVLNAITPGSTDFQVKVVLPNRSGRLRPGMAVEGIVSLPSASGIRVPVTAFTDDTHSAVLTVGADDTVATATVSEIADDGKSAVVNGLAPGTRVIANGQTSVGNGDKVAVR